MPVHVVQQGECLVRIASDHGFRDFHTVWDHPENAVLRAQRPDPNLLFPGDALFVPEVTPRNASAATDRVHRFRVAAPRRVLRLVLEDIDGHKLADHPYTLAIAGRLLQGQTGGDGLIEHEVPLGAETGLLTTASFVWPLSLAHLNPLDDAPDDGVSGYQARLRNLGYDPGPIDGIAGPLTAAAVLAFQEDHPPLDPDGICGPLTRAVLVERYGC